MFDLIRIDAGHGGEDPGAAGQYSYEKDITLKTAHILDYLLFLEGYETKLTRDDDVKPSWTERVISSKIDLYVSIHCNAVNNKNVRGIETFHYPGSAAGKMFAEEVQKELMKRIDTKNRGVKKQDFYVLRETACPAILVETGFITNENEEEKLNTLEYQCKIAVSIIEAIKKIKGCD